LHELFEKTPLAWKKILEWSTREEEFVKRTAFAMIACIAWHDRDAEDEKIILLLPAMKRAATDERNYVRKAVNWSLRNIGKRNPNLNRAAIHAAKEIQRMNSDVARWIASDAVKEFRSVAVQKRQRKRKTKS